MTRRLTDIGRARLVEYERLYHAEGCRCWLLGEPCPTCTHPGNPLNLQQDPTMWHEAPDDETR